MPKMTVKLAREIVYARSLGICEMCACRRATNWHHRQSRGRVWTPENGLHLCGSGTTGCHGWVTHHPELGREWGWVVSNAPAFHPAEEPAVIKGVWHLLQPDGGLVRLDRPLPGPWPF